MREPFWEVFFSDRSYKIVEYLDLPPVPFWTAVIFLGLIAAFLIRNRLDERRKRRWQEKQRREQEEKRE